MQCPIDGTHLVLAERAGVEIGYCPQCRGGAGWIGASWTRSSTTQPQRQLLGLRHRCRARPRSTVTENVPEKSAVAFSKIFSISDTSLEAPRWRGYARECHKSCQP